MYAVIRTGGKQYKVKAGDVIDVEKLAGAQGDSVELTPLLVVGDDGALTTDRGQLGGVRITASVLDQRRGKKIRVFTYKNKTGQQRTQGHRQSLTRLRVERIEVPQGVPAAAGPGSVSTTTPPETAGSLSTATPPETAGSPPATQEG